MSTVTILYLLVVAALIIAGFIFNEVGVTVALIIIGGLVTFEYAGYLIERYRK